MAREDYLFLGRDWHAVDQGQRQALLDDVARLDPDRLLNTSIADLMAHMVEKYQIDVPVLEESEIVVGQYETKIDVSQDPFRLINDRSRPCYVAGSRIDVEIPFTGEAAAFEIRPSTYSLNPPRAKVQGSMVTFSIAGTSLDPNAVRNEIQQMVGNISGYLANLRANVEALNRQLPNEARRAIEARRDKVLANRNTVAALGFKMKPRDGAATYVPKEVRRKLTPTLPPATSAPYKPEPAIAPTDYEHILSVMHEMTQVMERSPSAFRDLDEESLRSHFLVQLNGHYQGQATGETFNYQGKTDILIRSEGRNIFIAECKFWAGPKKLSETLDQLLGYSAWRDTKTAVVVFNRNRDFSKVLAAIPTTVRAHPQYKRDASGSTETSFRYVFAHKDDSNRELYLTVMAFDVPAPSI
ncbi:hypothetical protein ACHZ97_00670 [Lysobacter soli]|uniref:hypothetical protein n=1 Tax=Lysobacter soli TaxID=453783 RepID=UPI0037C78724